jgi:phosphohistidine phosphatase
MKVYIVRHGIAEDYHPRGDAARELTEAGRTKARKVFQFVGKTIKPEVLLTSPLVRAVQTAELAADVFGMKRQVEKSNALLPGSGSDDVITELIARNEDAVVLFGHNPHLSRLVSDIISRGGADIQLKKASVTALEFEGNPGEGRGLLKWMVTPGLLGL